MHHSTPQIVTNCRGGNEPWATVALDRGLPTYLGYDAVFPDWRSIQHVIPFDSAFFHAFRTAAVLLVRFGDRWLQTSADGIRQLALREDWVREIVATFTFSTTVMPVLEDPYRVGNRTDIGEHPRTSGCAGMNARHYLHTTIWTPRHCARWCTAFVTGPEFSLVSVRVRNAVAQRGTATLSSTHVVPRPGFFVKRDQQGLRHAGKVSCNPTGNVVAALSATERGAPNSAWRRGN